MKRLFRLKSEQIGDRRVAVHRITCTCGNTTTVSSSAGGNPLPPEVVAKHFRVKGWDVGDRDGADTCPDCIAALKAERRKQRLKLVEDKAKDAQPEDALDLAAETFEAMKEPPVAQPAQKIEPAPAAPRVLTREDRRIIFTSINDVYLDADRGYKPGQSDKRVAEGLGVPVEWVSEIRDEMFGPAGESVEVRELLERIEALREEAQRDLDQMASIVADATRRMDELAHRLNMLSVQATRLAETL